MIKKGYGTVQNYIARLALSISIARTNRKMSVYCCCRVLDFTSIKSNKLVLNFKAFFPCKAQKLLKVSFFVTIKVKNTICFNRNGLVLLPILVEIFLCAWCGVQSCKNILRRVKTSYSSRFVNWHVRLQILCVTASNQCSKKWAKLRYRAKSNIINSHLKNRTKWRIWCNT